MKSQRLISLLIVGLGLPTFSIADQLNAPIQNQSRVSQEAQAASTCPACSSSPTSSAVTGNIAQVPTGPTPASGVDPEQGPGPMGPLNTSVPTSPAPADGQPSATGTTDGQTPAAGTTGTGQTPAAGTTGTGQTPAAGATGTGQTPAAGTTGTGQTPAAGATGTGQTPAAGTTGTELTPTGATGTEQTPTGATGSGQTPAANTNQTQSTQSGSTSTTTAQTTSSSTPSLEESICIIREINKGEIKLSKQMLSWLKKDKGEISYIGKKLANRIIDDHKIIDGILDTLILNKHITPATVDTSPQCKKVQEDSDAEIVKLSGYKGAGLVRQFVADMRDGHAKGETLVTGFANNASDLDIARQLNEIAGLIHAHNTISTEDQETLNKY